MNERISILLIEDNPGDVRLIREMLRESAPLEFDFASTGSLAYGIRHLDEQKIDVILLDLGLPESQGLETLARVIQEAKSIPIVVLTGLADETLGANAISAGAQDYLVKGQVASGSLVRAISYAIKRKRSEERMRSLNECFLSFGADPVQNINCLVSLCGRLLEGDCALYNRLDQDMLCSLGQWNVPQDYYPVDAPEGHICFDVIRSGNGEVLIIRNLPATKYARTDPNVARYGLKTYIGVPVRFGGAGMGSLCVVYQRDFVPEQDDKHILGIMAAAIGIEEERRHSQEALVASEKKYRLLHESMTDAFVSVDMSGRINDFNRAYREMLEYSGEELLKLTHIDLTPEKWHEFEARIVSEDILPKGFSGVYEKEYRKKDGTVFPVELRTFLIRDEKGSPLSMWAIVRDITERKRAEEEKLRLLQMMDFAGDAIIIRDYFTDMITYWNTGAEKMYGWPDEEVLGKHIHTFLQTLFPKPLDEIEEEFVRNSSWEGELVHACRDGKKRIVLSRWTLQRDSEGKPSGLLEINTDITGRKEAESEADFLASIIRNIPEAVCSIDPEGNIVAWNEGAENMLGYRKEEVLGKPITITIPEGLAKGELDHCTVALSREGSFAGCESVRLTKNGTIIPVEITAVALKDEKGNITGYTSIIRDITERREAHETLLKLFQEKEEEAEISRSLLSMVETINTSLDEREVIRKLMGVASKYLKFDRGAIFLYDAEVAGLKYAGGFGLTPAEEGIVLSQVFRKGDSQAVDMALNGETIIVENAAESGLISRKLVDSLHIGCVVIVPVSFRHKVIGTIYADYRDLRVIEQKSVALLKGLADGTAAALQNSRLYRESVERTMELSGKIETIKTMSQLDKEILSNIDKATILKTATFLINRVIPSERTAILLREGDTYGIASEWGLGSFIDKSYAVPGSHFASGENGGSSLYILDIETDDCPYHREQTALGMKSALLVPIVTKDGVAGFIDIGTVHRGRLTPENLSTAENIASQIAVALENARLYDELGQLLISTITALASAIDAKSPWTKGHSERVTLYAVEIGKEMGLAEKELENLRLSGLLHDVGKIGTYDVLLDKPGKFTDAEYEIVKKHPGKGADILAPIRQLKDIIPGVLYHHERMDGRGYPEGLKGEEIPLCARILCAADSFDAMTADRPYRASPGIPYAVSELKRCSGTQFDTRVVEAFLRVLEGKEAQGRQTVDSF